MMKLLKTYRDLYTLRYASVTLVQVVFSAGTVFLLLAVRATSGVRVAEGSLGSALSQAELCIQYLLEIGKSWQCSTNIAEILRNLLHEQLKPVLERRSSRRIASVKASSHPHTVAPQADASGSLATTSPASPNQPTPVPDLSQQPESPDMQWTYLPDTAQDTPWSDYGQGLFNGNSSATAMEYSSFLATLGGEPLSESPFIPPFSSLAPTSVSGFDYPSSSLSHVGTEIVDISESELAELERFFDENFR